MLHDLTDNDGFVALKWAAEGREGWRQKRYQKPALQLKTTEVLMMETLSHSQVHGTKFPSSVLERITDLKTRLIVA